MNSRPTLCSVSAVAGNTFQCPLTRFTVSAGYDAAEGDPLGGCEVTPAGYAHMTYMLSALAKGRLVLALEVSS